MILLEKEMKELKIENQQLKKEFKKFKKTPRINSVNNENTPKNYNYQGSHRSANVSESATQVGTIRNDSKDSSVKQRFLLSKESKNTDQDGL